MLDALEHFQVPSADLLSGRLQHLPSAKRLRRGRAANDEGLSPASGGGLLQKDLGHSPTTGLDRVTVQKRDGPHDFRRADVEANGRAMLDRPAGIGQAVQPDREHSGGDKVAGSRQLLPSHHVLVMDAGQIEGRPLASMNLFHRTIVILKRPHSDPFAARLPL
jgi:hypothetical protein